MSGKKSTGVFKVVTIRDGYSNAVVQLFRRYAPTQAEPTPALPTGTLTYTFSTGVLSGASASFNGWSQQIPAATDGTKLFVTMATARSQGATDDIIVDSSATPPVNEWSTPVEYVADGMAYASVTIYKRSATAPTDKPDNNARYYFKTVGSSSSQIKAGTLVAPSGGSLNGWSTVIPDNTSGLPCWTRQATAVAHVTDDYDEIASTEWSDPATRFVEDGENSVRLALDNQHEDFIYSDSRVLPIAPNGGAQSPIHLYDGATEVTSGFTLVVDFTKSNGIPGSSDTHKPTISNGVLTVPHITADTAKVVVKCTYPSTNGEDYYAEFTGNKTTQDKYDLILKPNAIAFNTSDIWSNKTVTPSAERTDLQGNKTTGLTIHTTAVDGLRLYYSYVKTDGTLLDPSLNLLSTSTFLLTETPANTYIGIYFELRLYSGSSYRMCDYETVEIAKTENGASGSNGDTPMQAFQWNQSATVAPSPLPNGGTLGDWRATAPNRPSGTGEYYLWMTQTVKHISANGTVTYDTWSSAVRISGNNGTNGEDGTDYEYIYILKTAQYAFPNNEKPANITKGEISPNGHAAGNSVDYNNTTDDWVPYEWWDNPQGIDATNKFEYMSLRVKPKGSDTWGAFSDPFIWSHWGRNGLDGDGTEYVFIRTKNNVEPIIADEGTSYLADEWKPFISNGAACDAEKHNNEYRTTDDPIGTNDTYKYEWVAKRNMTAANSTTGERTWKSYRECIGSPYKMSLWTNYAESNLIIDLDNMADQFGTDSNNVVVGNQVLSTGVNIFYGATKQVFSGNTPLTAVLYYASDDGELSPINDSTIAEVSCAVDQQDATQGTVTVTIKNNAVITDTGLFAKITAKCARDTNGKTAYFNLGKVKSGAPGIAPDICNLRPTTNSINFTKSEQQGTTRKIIGCGYTLVTTSGTTNVATAESVTVNGTLYYIYWRYVGGTYAKFTTSSSIYATGILPSTSESGVEFCLSSATSASGITAANTLDYEKVPILKDGGDGVGQPDYIQTQEAWSNVESLVDDTTEPTPNSGWSDTVPSNPNNYAYLWRRSRKMVLQSDGSYAPSTDGSPITYGTWRYTRLSGTNGTSIKTKGTLAAVVLSSGMLPTTGISVGDLGIKQGSNQIYRYQQVYTSTYQWVNYTTADDGDSYTMLKDCNIDLNDGNNPVNIKGHLLMWSDEAHASDSTKGWIDLGQFKGDNGTTYYTHIAWATNVDTNIPWSGTIPSGQISTPNYGQGAVTGGDVTPASDGSKPWMGVLINTDSGADTTHWHYYTWNETKGADGDDAVLHYLEANPDHVNFRSDATGVFPSTPENVKCKIKKVVGDTETVINNGTEEGLYLYYEKVGAPDHPYAYTSAGVSVYASEALDSQYPVSAVKFTLSTASSYEDITSDNTIKVLRVPVICDGRRGAVGATGKMFYSMGTWDPTKSDYGRTDDFVPLVYYDDGTGSSPNPYTGVMGDFWYVKDGVSVVPTGSAPSNSSQYWAKANSFGVVITSGIFADFAKLAKAIMSGDCMFSMNGRIGDTEYLDGATVKYMDGSTEVDTHIPAYMWFVGDPSASYDEGDFSEQYTLNKEEKMAICGTVLLKKGMTFTATVKLKQVESTTRYLYLRLFDANNVRKNFEYKTDSASSFTTVSEINLPTTETEYIIRYTNTGNNDIQLQWNVCNNSIIYTRKFQAQMRYQYSGVFEPNWWVDLLTGKMSAARGNFIVNPDGSVEMAGGNLTVSPNGDLTMRGTVKAKNLYHRLAMAAGIVGNNSTEYTFLVGENNTTEYCVYCKTSYGSAVAGRYYKGTASQITSQTGVPVDEWRDNMSGDYNFFLCTGDADEVIIADFDGGNNTDRIVHLPRCEDYVGKTVTVRHTATSSSSTFNVRIFQAGAMPNDSTQVGKFVTGPTVNNSGDWSVNYGTNPTSYQTLNVGDTAVYLSTGTYWIRIGYTQKIQQTQTV